MKIIFDQLAAKELAEKHLILELDTFFINDQSKTIYCLIDNIDFDKLHLIDEFRALHQQFVEHYQQQQYQQCQNLISQLKKYGFYDVESYYDVMTQRLEKLCQDQQLNK